MVALLRDGQDVLTALWPGDPVELFLMLPVHQRVVVRVFDENGVRVTVTEIRQ